MPASLEQATDKQHEASSRVAYRMQVQRERPSERELPRVWASRQGCDARRSAASAPVTCPRKQGCTRSNSASLGSQICLGRRTLWRSRTSSSSSTDVRREPPCYGARGRWFALGTFGSTLKGLVPSLQRAVRVVKTRPPSPPPPTPRATRAGSSSSRAAATRPSARAQELPAACEGKNQDRVGATAGAASVVPSTASTTLRPDVKRVARVGDRGADGTCLFHQRRPRDRAHPASTPHTKRARPLARLRTGSKSIKGIYRSVASARSPCCKSDEGVTW